MAGDILRSKHYLLCPACCRCQFRPWKNGDTVWSPFRGRECTPKLLYENQGRITEQKQRGAQRTMSPGEGLRRHSCARQDVNLVWERQMCAWVGKALGLRLEENYSPRGRSSRARQLVGESRWEGRSHGRRGQRQAASRGSSGDWGAREGWVSSAPSPRTTAIWFLLTPLV